MNRGNRSILKSHLNYHLSKILPKGMNLSLKLRNGIEYIVRSKTMDRSIVKEVWMWNIYDQHGIKISDGDTVIDIGAHMGVFSVYASELNPSGKIYAFEPFIENFRKLEEHKQINKKHNLEVYNKGISDSEGTKTLFLSPDNNTGGHSLHLKQDSDRTVEIQTIRLDTFCQEKGIEKINYLKLDCEGAEFDILNSNKDILKMVDKIALECHPFEDNTIDSMTQLLARYGFKTYQENKPSHLPQMIYGKKS